MNSKIFSRAVLLHRHFTDTWPNHFASLNIFLSNGRFSSDSSAYTVIPSQTPTTSVSGSARAHVSFPFIFLPLSISDQLLISAASLHADQDNTNNDFLTQRRRQHQRHRSRHPQASNHLGRSLRALLRPPSHHPPIQIHQKASSNKAPSPTLTPHLPTTHPQP